jgi:hypothetical protein
VLELRPTSLALPEIAPGDSKTKMSRGTDLHIL